MTTLIVVRHGESIANVHGMFAGVTDVPLSQKGEEQAAKTAEYILKNYKIDKIYSSFLERAYNTAMPIAQKLNIEIEKSAELREINGGKWEKVLFDDLEREASEEYKKWLSDVGNSKCPEGESVRELSDRIFTEVLRITKENDGKTVLITTHATPVKALACKILYGGTDKMNNMQWVSNASVTEIEYENGKFKVVKLGEDSHLAGMQSRLPENV